MKVLLIVVPLAWIGLNLFALGIVLILAIKKRKDWTHDDGFAHRL